MLSIDLTGHRAFVAGVADDQGYGFAIAKALAEAGASIVVGTWPPALGVFQKLLERGSMDESMALSGERKMEFEAIYPLDAAFDTMDGVPPDVAENRRYQDMGDFTIDGVASRLVKDFGEQPLDIVIHSLANGPEIKKPLLETSRGGYLAAISVSAYSAVAMVQRFGPIMKQGGAFLSLTYLAGQRVTPGYGGGMSSAKAALENDTRTLAYEAGRRFGVRVNCISAGPLASRAARAIGGIDLMVQFYSLNAPIQDEMEASEVGNTAAFLCSPLASGVTGTVLFVDHGYSIMGAPSAEGGLKLG